MKKFGASKWLLIIFILMLIVAIIFEASSDIISKIVTSVVFVLVGFIFIRSYKRNFKPASLLKEDLSNAIDTIKTDYKKNNKKLLWNKYSSTKKNLFKEDSILYGLYREYMKESGRLAQNPNGFGCDIEDYINEELFDKIFSKHITGLVSGTMTGLGILGTFVGLTLSLQNFNTGTADEIQRSIAPLMDGIKVAFHTSILGMVFSLVFNFVYKYEVTEANKIVNDFIDIYKKYVKNTKNDNISSLMTYQKDMSLALGDKFIERLSLNLSESIGNIMTPQFERMNNTIEEFAKVASQSQVEAIEKVVNNFVEKMNDSLNGKFEKLANVIDETCKMQEKNNEKMEKIVIDIGNLSDNILKINELSIDNVKQLNSYVNKLKELQDKINDSCNLAQQQLEKNNELIGYSTQNLDKMVQISNIFTEQIAKLDSIQDISVQRTQQIAKTCDEILSNMSDVSQQCIKNIIELSNQNNENLTEVSNALAQQISEVNEKTTGIVQSLGDNCNNYLEGMKQVSTDNITAISQTADKQIESMTSVSNALAQQISEVNEKTTGIVQSLGDNCNNYLEGMKQVSTDNITAISQTADKQIAHLLEMSRGFNNDINASVDKLNEASNRLAKKLLISFDNTFNSFDKQLSDICSHLGGTISEIKETTNNASELMSSLYDDMDKVLNDFVQVVGKLEILTNIDDIPLEE